MFFSLELLGRWWTIVIANIIFTVGAVLCTVPTHQLGLIYAGRLLTGLGVGGIAAVCPIYVTEFSPPAIRGRLTGFFESSYQIGAVSQLLRRITVFIVGTRFIGLIHRFVHLLS